MVGIVLTVMISMIALQFELPVAPSWLFSFAGVGTPYQPPIAIIVILLIALTSAVLGRYLTATGWRRARATDATLASELVDSDLELSFLNALESEDYSPVANVSKTSRLLFRVVLKNRKVYIGNLTRCDLTRGNSKSIVIQPIFKIKETLSHFSVTIPISEIVTTSMFNLQSYIDFLEEKEARSS